jgi:predicted PhzF superfamily epimerase YddE/YHI9
MISYLLQYGEVEPGTYTLEQGDVMKRPGRVQAETGYDKDGNVAPPKIGGRAITVMRGEITV